MSLCLSAVASSDGAEEEVEGGKAKAVPTALPNECDSVVVSQVSDEEEARIGSGTTTTLHGRKKKETVVVVDVAYQIRSTCTCSACVNSGDLRVIPPLIAHDDRPPRCRP